MTGTSTPFTLVPEGTDVSSSESFSTSDEDEEILYHMTRMQLHNARKLAKRMHREGYNTMDQLVDADLAHIVHCFGIGSGDVEKLAKGLQHYQGGTFEDSHALPLHCIVHTLETPTCIDIGIQKEPSTEDAGAQAEMALQVIDGMQDQPVNAGQRTHRNLVIRRSHRSLMEARVDKIIGLLAASGVPFVAIATIIMGKKCGDPNRQCFFSSTAMGGMLMSAGSTLAMIRSAVTGGTLPYWGVGFVGGLATTMASVIACDITTGGCFSSSAQVMLSNRSHKIISDLREGDRILSFNKGVFRIKRVLRCIKSDELTRMRRVHFCLPGGEQSSLLATPGHPLWIHGKGWCAVPENRSTKETRSRRELVVKDKLVHHTGAAAQVTAIESEGIMDKPFNLVVDGPGTFFVSGLLVHSHMDSKGQVYGKVL